MAGRTDIQPMDLLTRKPEKLVDILRRPVPPDASCLPSQLSAYIESLDANLVLDNASPNVTSMRSGTGQYVLLIQDLPGAAPLGDKPTEEEKKQKAWFQGILREAAEMAFQKREDGALVRGDCVLYIQSKAQRKQLDDESRLIFLMQDSPDAAREFAEGISDKLGLKNVLGRGEGLFPLTTDRLHDHVKRGEPRHPAGE